jgi:hypothetical protein
MSTTFKNGIVVVLVLASLFLLHPVYFPYCKPWNRPLKCFIDKDNFENLREKNSVKVIIIILLRLQSCLLRLQSHKIIICMEVKNKTFMYIDPEVK